MSGYRNRTLQRVDATAKGLISHAEALGAKYLPINGIIDGVLLYRGKTLLVDWKSKATPYTKDQQKLVDTGWPLHFVRTQDELAVLLLRQH